ncbi:MAG: hypothetical protein U0174_22815 [Polyangiaceae bacterium]
MTLGIDVPVELCTAERKYEGCVVARREIAFIPGERLRVPIGLYLACKNVPCDERTTCKSGTGCIPASIDPGGPGATDGGIDAPPDAPPGPSDAGDAAPDAGPTCKLPSDCPTIATVPLGCSEPRCENGACIYVARDADGDLDRAATCAASNGKPPIQLGTDCDDADPNISGTLERACAMTSNGIAIVFPSDPPKGACKKGTQACVGPTPGPCVGAVGPTTDGPTVNCNGKDDDCDGTIDNGCACTNGMTQPCGSNIGECTQGTQSCSGSMWGTCVGGTSPKPRDCTSNLDLNCNGTPDRNECPCLVGSTRVCNAPALGECSKGTQLCEASGDKTTSSWGACMGGIPHAFNCANNLDNDCNGVIDSDEYVTIGGVHVGNVCANLYVCETGITGTPRNPLIYTGAGGEYTSDPQIPGVVVGYATTSNGPPGGGAFLVKNRFGKVVPEGVASPCAVQSDANGSYFFANGGKFATTLPLK